jgi:Rrf2 family protein
MKINTRARYAIRMMADIMKSSNGNTVPLKDVANRQNLSKRYLSQLAIPLKNAKLLKSVWGMNGGYMLALAPEEISILDIVEAVDGPVNIIDCITSENPCDRAPFCECNALWQDINDTITSRLAEYTLADLDKGIKKKLTQRNAKALAKS